MIIQEIIPTIKSIEDNIIRDTKSKYLIAELNAGKLLNSKEINHRWKKDFRKDRTIKRIKSITFPDGSKIEVSGYTIKEAGGWDLINSDGIKIEVKSTIVPEYFRINHISCFSNTRQHKSIVMKLLIDENGEIKDYKFVKKIKEGWITL